MPGSAELFGRFPNATFVETGSYLGDGIQAALDAGFRRVVSIELSDKYFGICSTRFANDPRVTLIQGDSAVALAQVLEGLQEPATFWLDGHWSAGDTARGPVTVPLLHEIRAIAAHPIKGNTLLIDDMRCWKTFNPVHGFEEKDIFVQLQALGSFTHEFVDSPHAPNDVLVVRQTS